MLLIAVAVAEEYAASSTARRRQHSKYNSQLVPHFPRLSQPSCLFFIFEKQ